MFILLKITLLSPAYNVVMKDCMKILLSILFFQLKVRKNDKSFPTNTLWDKVVPHEGNKNVCHKFHPEEQSSS